MRAEWFAAASATIFAAADGQLIQTGSAEMQVPGMFEESGSANQTTGRVEKTDRGIGNAMDVGLQDFKTGRGGVHENLPQSRWKSDGFSVANAEEMSNFL